jgi:hypothetical protein
MGPNGSQSSFSLSLSLFVSDRNLGPHKFILEPAKLGQPILQLISHSFLNECEKRPLEVMCGTSSRVKTSFGRLFATGTEPPGHQGSSLRFITVVLQRIKYTVFR